MTTKRMRPSIPQRIAAEPLQVLIHRALTATSQDAILTCVKLLAAERNDATATNMHYIDMLYYLILFCRKNGLTSEKSAACVMVANRAWETCTGTPFNNFDVAFEEFEKDLTRFSVHRPPYSEAILSLKEAKLMLDYFQSTFFAHFKMYKYACTTARRMHLTVTAEDEQQQQQQQQRQQAKDEENGQDGCQVEEHSQDGHQSNEDSLNSIATPASRGNSSGNGLNDDTSNCDQLPETNDATITTSS